MGWKLRVQQRGWRKRLRAIGLVALSAGALSTSSIWIASAELPDWLISYRRKPRVGEERVFSTFHPRRFWASITNSAPELEERSEKSGPLEPTVAQNPYHRSSKIVALGRLPISRDFYDRLAVETESGGRQRDDEKSSAVRIGHRVISKKGEQAASTQTLTPFQYRVVSFTPGKTDQGDSIRPAPEAPNPLEWLVVGPPDTSLNVGGAAASEKLLSLGHGGQIVLEVEQGEIVDEPGPDFLVFENPFRIEGRTTSTGDPAYSVETAYVAVAEVNRPEAFRPFPCDSARPIHDEKEEPSSCAGVVPVRFRPDAPLDDVGGDSFDLASIGLQRAKFVRITDTGDNRGPSQRGKEGFDLDGLAFIHTLAK